MLGSTTLEDEGRLSCCEMLRRASLESLRRSEEAIGRHPLVPNWHRNASYRTLMSAQH